MNYPICTECLSKDALCSSCEDGVKKGAISQLDVEVSRYMRELETKFDINGVDLMKTHDLGPFILIVGKGKISGMIGKGGRNIKLMANHFNKKVRIIKHGDIRQMMADLVAPAQISGVNVLYSNDGEKYKVVIPLADKRKIYMDEKTLNKALEVLFNGNVAINYQ